MSYLRFLNQFNALENEGFFSDSARGLFQRLLYHFNKTRQWDAALPVNVPFLQLLTGSSPNTVVKALAELQGRGVIAYQEAPRGRGKMGLIRLLKVYRIKAGADEIKPSDFDGLSDGFSDDFNYVAPVKPSAKPSAKPSNSDDTIRGVREVRDVTTEVRPAQKKEGLAEADLPDRGAPHTGGGAADVGTRMRPVPLAEGETIRQRVPEHLPESDPNKYAAVPRDLEMVRAYLAGHPDPDISKHASKANLFFDHYEKNGWNNKHGRPIHNWQAAAREFSYRDYKAENAAKSGGQIEQRSSGIDEARAFLRSQRGQKGEPADG